MSTRPEGITHPSIDELLASTESKYSLVIWAARRARQLTGYYSQMGDYLLEYVGPLVETHPQEKPMSIALREIHSGLLVERTDDPGAAQIPDDGSFFAAEPATTEPELVAVDTTELATPDESADPTT
jgi:DNA-directed RNA polymerase subunit omega